MARRGEHADETRRRIVHATYELHAERGIAATSMRDIAERADVAVGTVYHHFPTYEEVIDACGKYTLALTRPPGPDAFAGAATPAARLGALVRATFDFYARFPGYGRVRAERGRFPRLERFFAEDEENRRSLLAIALRPARPARRTLALGAALLDFEVHRTLVAGGTSHANAISDVAALLEQLFLPHRPREDKP